MEAFEGLRFLASFGPPGTGKRKGGEKTQPFNHFHSHPGIRLSQRKSTLYADLLNNRPKVTLKGHIGALIYLLSRKGSRILC